MSHEPGLPEIAVAIQRLDDTLRGGVLILVAAMIAISPHLTRDEAAEAMTTLQEQIVKLAS